MQLLHCTSCCCYLGWLLLLHQRQLRWCGCGLGLVRDCCTSCCQRPLLLLVVVEWCVGAIVCQQLCSSSSP